MDTFDMLNAIYVPLCDKAAIICQELENAGYRATVQFHNNHSIKRDHGFAIEHFPIPVVLIENLGSIGIDIDSVWFEAILPKERALQMDYEEITRKYKIDLYGSESFLSDLYNDQMDVSEIVSNISNSPDTDICILFYLSAEVSSSEVIQLMQSVTA